jgi:hypothetical protein
MHAYYTEFDWLPRDELEQLLPEDGLPETLVVHDLEPEKEPAALTRAVFQEWLWEGRHECQVAISLLRLWATTARESSHDTLADFFDGLLQEYRLSTAAEPCTAASEESPSEALPVPFLAALVQRYGHAPFPTSGLSRADIEARLCEAILEEVSAVQGYVNAWRGTAVVPEPERHLMSDTLCEVAEKHVGTWPQVERDPVPLYEEGRFVKAFPLQFPMGVGDLVQSGLRDDFSAVEWAQHKFRYHDGRFVSSQHGHRVTWAIFNTALLERSKDSGQAFFRAADRQALTKAELRTLVESREDLVRDLATFGAEIPTTPMFWKRQTRELEWIVRQMSWSPPWVAPTPVRGSELWGRVHQRP